MLVIQKFIKLHKDDWEERLLRPPYNLKISRAGDLVLFKYSQINSDFSQKICCEARGLILDSANDFKVVRMAFEKFFNYEEPYATPIDWESAVAAEKIDGSLISVWFYNGEWRVSTNSTINAEDAPLADQNFYKNFYDLFCVASRNSGLRTDKLNPNYCYTFELVSKFNKIVISYDEPALYHIMTRDLTTLEEVEVDCGVQKPRQYSLNSKAAYELLVRSFDESHEGIVVKDKFGTRVKIKTPLYFQLHRTINNGALTAERILEIIRANEQDEFLSYFPELRERFEDIKKQEQEALEKTGKIIFEVGLWQLQHLGQSNRRAFASKYKDKPYSSLYFLAYDGKIQHSPIFSDCSKFVKFFNIK